MKWHDQGYILSLKSHGENSRLVSIFTCDHGRHAGLWRASKRTQSLVQVGCFTDCNWSARLPEHLGMWQLEIISSPMGRLFQDKRRFAAVTSLTTLVDQLLPERHLYQDLYYLFDAFMQQRIWQDDWLAAYVAYELSLLEQLGFGLDLQRCAATGQTTDLIYVSPKTGRAVSAAAGEPYKDRLLRLPSYFLSGHEPTADDLQLALQLVGYFLQQHLANKGLPSQRQQLLSTSM